MLGTINPEYNRTHQIAVREIDAMRRAINRELSHGVNLNDFRLFISNDLLRRICNYMTLNLTESTIRLNGIKVVRMDVEGWLLAHYAAPNRELSI